MDWLFGVAAALLLAIVVFDLVKATLTLHGAGPVTSRAALYGWRLLRRLDRRHQRKRLMSYAGQASRP